MSLPTIVIQLGLLLLATHSKTLRKHWRTINGVQASRAGSPDLPLPGQWTATSAGSRCVSAFGAKTRVLDFNPLFVRRFTKGMWKGDAPTDMVAEATQEIHSKAFRDFIVGCLQYVAIEIGGTDWEYAGVLMDSEHLLGLKAVAQLFSSSDMLLLLPPELTVRIISLLDLRDILKIKRVHSTFRDYVKSFNTLQYRIATLSAGVENNQHSTVSISDRLEVLNSLQLGWARGNVDFKKTVPVLHQPSGIYDLKGGVYLLGDVDRRTLHYFTLPCTPDDEVVWKKIEIEKLFVDIGLAIYEHDLIAVFTSSVHPTQLGMHVLEIQLLEFSTGKPHPRARTPALFIAESYHPRPSISCEIVGRNLILLTTNHISAFPPPSDHFYIFDWVTGERKLGLQASQHTYASLIFLTPELILLPNTRRCSLDIWAIPSAADSDDAPTPQPLLVLALPGPSPANFLISITCRAEPNPSSPSSSSNSSSQGSQSLYEFGAAHVPHSHRPFHPATQEALIIFSLRMHNVNTGSSSTWSMFVRKGDLVAFCKEVLEAEKKLAGETRREYDPMRSWEEALNSVLEVPVDYVDQFGIAIAQDDSPDGEDELGLVVDQTTDVDTLGIAIGLDGAQGLEEGLGSVGDELPNYADPVGIAVVHHGAQDSEESDFLLSELPDNDGGGDVEQDNQSDASSDSEEYHDAIAGSPYQAPIPHDQWGHLARWFCASSLPARWITTSAGSRCVHVVTHPDPDEPFWVPGRSRIGVRVLDFNPHVVRRFAGGAWQGDVLADMQVEVVTAPQEIHDSCFQDVLKGGLPYVAIEMGGAGWEYAGMLMDSEHLLGLRVSVSVFLAGRF
ncbi:hypothetical protein H0H81_006828 [Sphagnurus paluster]|uniref:F-box domain-containing protein n=1 Tax=Sphagnurus paluster TaxID=117069 RepID=A0A9P7KJE8_9AGAR|nr:hypothetical protein H0H81_006828 [Sphagnurus paluster]